VTGTKIVGATAPVSLFPFLTFLTFVFLVLLITVPGYFVWDGFFTRKLTNVEVSGRAQLKLAGWVEFQFYPLDENRKYIVVYLDNPSDYIIRGATVSAQIKFKSAGGAAPNGLPPGWRLDDEPARPKLPGYSYVDEPAPQAAPKPDTTITVPSTPCVGPHSEFRVLARTTTNRQTCIVTLSAEQSKLIPVDEWQVRSDGHRFKSVDLDALEFSWGLTSVEGHSQPIKILQDIADWLGIDKLKAQFARVNR
jgi:hypothetical protein